MLLVVLCAKMAHGQAAAEPPIKLAEVVVIPSSFGVSKNGRGLGVTLTSSELESLPQIGDDLYRSIARLPGLAADDFTAQFWVRGAPNSQLLARLDGVELIEPFHLKDVDGALSIIDPQTIQRLDLITGGFTADYGNRVAGVLTMETKTASVPLTALQLSLTGVSASHQGLFANGRGRWLVAARRGYPDVALRIAGREDEVSPRYYDATAKVEYQLAPEQTVSFHVLHAGDTLRYHRTNDPSLSSSYDSDYAWGRWRGALGSRVTGETVLSFARLTWSRNGSGQLDGFPFALRDDRRLDVAGLRQEWAVMLGERALLRGGVDVRTSSSRYDYSLSHQHLAASAGRQITVSDLVNTRLRPEGEAQGAFASVRFQPWAALVLEPGVRFDRQDFSRDRNASPRLNLSLALGKATMRAAWGVYRQSQGIQELAVPEGETVFHRAEMAEHRVIGLEQPLPYGVSLRVEAYERITSRLAPRWENLDNPYDLFPEAQSDLARLDPKRGRARGLEALVSGRAGSRLKWNASYALAHAEEYLAGSWVPRSRDQRHTFYGDVTFAPGKRWEFSAAWQYHTGWPTTDVTYSLTPLTNGRRLLVSANGPVYGLRLADYHRLDFRATRRFHFTRSDLRLFIDVFNAYDRANVIGYEHHITVTGTQVTDEKKPREQLPILPSAGVSWEL